MNKNFPNDKLRYPLKNLKVIRHSKGLSLGDIAFEVKISQQTLSGWEKGLYSASIEKAMILANFLDVSLYDLIGVNPENL